MNDLPDEVISITILLSVLNGPEDSLSLQNDIDRRNGGIFGLNIPPKYFSTDNSGSRCELNGWWHQKNRRGSRKSNKDPLRV